MIFTVLCLTAAGNDGICVTLRTEEGENSCKENFVISIDEYTKLNLSKGECTRETYEILCAEAKIYSAYKRGLYILGFGACSRKALITKLVTKGFGRESATLAVERIAEKGFIDDTASAIREAEICVSKLWGEMRIRASLLQKGYEKQQIDAALFALEDAGVDFGENCKELIKRRYTTLPTDRAQAQKLIAAITRYGYSVSQIKSACADIENEE